MPLGDFEKSILRLVAVNRNPESYIAWATVFFAAGGFAASIPGH
jgi:hypothetical protein